MCVCMYVCVCGGGGCDTIKSLLSESDINILSSSSPFVVMGYHCVLDRVCASKSPHAAVLLHARAFPQCDVVHRHLAALAPPTLPLQDHLGNGTLGYC